MCNHDDRRYNADPFDLASDDELVSPKGDWGHPKYETKCVHCNAVWCRRRPPPSPATPLSA
jgi:hypothetical protein